MRRSSDFLSAKSCLVYGKSGQRASMNLSSVHTLQGPKPKCERRGTLSLKSVQVSLYFFICVSPFNHSVQILTLFLLNLSSFVFCHLSKMIRHWVFSFEQSYFFTCRKTYQHLVPWSNTFEHSLMATSLLDPIFSSFPLAHDPYTHLNSTSPRWQRP